MLNLNMAIIYNSHNMKNAKINRIIDSLFEGLNPRQKEVIVGRFGLSESGNANPLTLAAIGGKYGVTRERVRQIEANSLSTLKSKVSENRDCQAILSRSKKFIENAGGVAEKGALLAHLASTAEGLTQNHLSFLIETSGAFKFYDEDKNYSAFYYLDKENLAEVGKFITSFAKFLESQKDVVLDGGFSRLFSEFAGKQKVKLAHAENFLSISRQFHTNPYGITGLADWGEIKPLNIRDRIYLILKKTGEPLHFESITVHINKIDFGTRKALAPTVHNELIKDSRFVLVGRGMYALAEHGYQPGTVQEVIKRILKNNGPLKPKDISTAVQKERIVKPNTILVNLQNKKHFDRLDNGTYRIRRA